MKKRLIAAGLMLALFTGTAAAVSSYTKTINVEYGVSLSINGKTPTLTDVNGKAVQPFVYDGTTYVPIRAVGTSIGARVGYDEKTNTAYAVGDINSTMELFNSANTLLRITRLSQTINYYVMMMNNYLDTDLPEKTAQSFGTALDSIKFDLDSLNQAKANDTSGKYNGILEVLNGQHQSYLIASTAFFKYKAGEKDQKANFFEAASQEASQWSSIQDSCETERQNLVSASLKIDPKLMV